MEKEHPSRTYLKKKYANFWKSGRWIPGRSIDTWAHLLSQQEKRIRSKYVLTNALIKLELERKITQQEEYNLRRMFDSPDKENWIMALSLMQSLHPKAFVRKKDKNL